MIRVACAPDRAAVTGGSVLEQATKSGVVESCAEAQGQRDPSLGAAEEACRDGAGFDPVAPRPGTRSWARPDPMGSGW